MGKCNSSAIEFGYKLNFWCPVYMVHFTMVTWAENACIVRKCPRKEKKAGIFAYYLPVLPKKGRKTEKFRLLAWILGRRCIDKQFYAQSSQRTCRIS